jgi:hypothetical protein
MSKGPLIASIKKAGLPVAATSLPPGRVIMLFGVAQIFSTQRTTFPLFSLGDELTIIAKLPGSIGLILKYLAVINERIINPF